MSGQVTALILGATLLLSSTLVFADGRLQGRVVTGEASAVDAYAGLLGRSLRHESDPVIEHES